METLKMIGMTISKLPSYRSIWRRRPKVSAIDVRPKKVDLFGRHPHDRSNCSLSFFEGALCNVQIVITTAGM